METFPRDHDRDPGWGEEIASAHKVILHKLFLVHVRLCTHKESAQDFFSPEAWGALLYEKFLLELPRILDMCVLFSACSPAITAKMVGNVFRHQPQYTSDLVECCLTVIAALDAATEQHQVLAITQPAPEQRDTLADLASYCVDISASLASLVTVYPASAAVLHNTGLDVRLASFYTTVVTPLLNLVHKYKSFEVLSDSDHDDHVTRVNISRHNIVTCIREVVCQLCFLDTAPVTERLESFFTVMSSLMSEISFLADYNELYCIRGEFEQFERENIPVDTVRKHYILDMFNTTQSSSFLTPPGAAPPPPRPQDSSAEVGGACALAARPSRPEVASLVAGVRDLLPHLGEGFVEAALESFGFKVDEVVNALLEGNLPPHLQALDQSLQRQEPQQPEPEPVLRSIYDGDEFDIFNRNDVDTTKIHKGKKNKSCDAKKLLEDKSDVWQMKDKFDRLGIVEDVEIIVKSEDPQLANDFDYDDEYDDTYDDVPIGEQEPDAKDDLGRGFVLPIALGGGKIAQSRPIDIDDSGSDEGDEDTKSKMNFVRNPEEVRKEMERKRQEKIARKHGGGGGGGGGAQNRDVVGRARGQGQDKQVLINRARKNANKGKGQRVGADRKAAKGMF